MHIVLGTMRCYLPSNQETANRKRNRVMTTAMDQKTDPKTRVTRKRRNLRTNTTLSSIHRVLTTCFGGCPCFWTLSWCWKKKLNGTGIFCFSRKNIMQSAQGKELNTVLEGASGSSRNITVALPPHWRWYWLKPLPTTLYTSTTALISHARTGTTNVHTTENPRALMWSAVSGCERHTGVL